jgi:hypothetical protein
LLSSGALIPKSGNRFSGKIVPFPGVMIAPEANGGKGLPGISPLAWAHHGFVNENIMLPNFGQGAAKLLGMMATVASGPVSKEHRIPQPPSPPGLQGTGPIVSRRFNPPTLQGRLNRRPFFHALDRGRSTASTYVA